MSEQESTLDKQKSSGDMFDCLDSGSCLSVVIADASAAGLCWQPALVLLSDLAGLAGRDAYCIFCLVLLLQCLAANRFQVKPAEYDNEST